MSRRAVHLVPTYPLLLVQALEEWDTGSELFACDTGPDAQPLSCFSSEAKRGGVLIGPEGGLSREDWKSLADYDFVQRVTLGQNILRAETAAMAALAIIGGAPQNSAR